MTEAELRATDPQPLSAEWNETRHGRHVHAECAVLWTPAKDCKTGGCLDARLAARDAEIARLREQLEKYGNHKRRCKKGQFTPCSCGWSPIYAALGGNHDEA